MPRRPSPNLAKILAYWQRRLKLSDWRIRIDWEARLPDSVRGRCFWEGSCEDAMILINPYKGLWDAGYPIERTIIHELLHLILAPAGDPCPEYIEEAVIQLTTIIWETKRKESHAP